MNSKRVLVALALAATLGLLASSFVYRTLARVATQATVAAKSVHVVVAAGPLPLGTRLQDRNLRVVSWPGSAAVRGGFSRVEDCAGRALIAAAVENEPILEGRLAPKEAGAGLPAAIPEGMRAVSVAVNEVIGVAGFVQPGTNVDVLVTGATTAGQGGGSLTQTILESVPVIAAGQKVEQDKEGRPQIVPVITLLVSPSDASKLTMASMQGRIQLALRNTIDSRKVAPAPVFQASLFGGEAPGKRAAVHPASPPRAESYRVEVIRGNKREVETFSSR